MNLYCFMFRDYVAFLFGMTSRFWVLDIGIGVYRVLNTVSVPKTCEPEHVAKGSNFVTWNRNLNHQVPVAGSDSGYPRLFAHPYCVVWDCRERPAFTFLGDRGTDEVLTSSKLYSDHLEDIT